MKKILLIGLLVTCSSLFGFNNKPASRNTNTVTNPPSQPNIIVIMVDDLGYADVSFNGSTEIPTPNIDRIANEGIKCTNAYVTYSVCGPSRAGFMTGRYPQRFGFERNPKYEPNQIAPGLPLSESTIAETLPEAYNTGVIGKWHLGAHPDNHPLNRGFDEFFGHLGGGHRYFANELTIQDSYSVHNENDSYRTWIMRDHNSVNPVGQKYLTEAFSDEAVSFIQNHAVNPDPFFLFLSYNAPHGPLQATQEYLDRFPTLSGDRKTYAAMVSAVDDGVGLILDQLVTSGIDSNTIVFFLSDNGGKTQYANNSPLRGGKSAAYEGGYRVPFAIRYNGTITPGIYNKQVSALDIYATAIALAGATQNPAKPLDGVNLIPYLTNVNTQEPHSEIYLRKFDQQRYAVTKDGYKLVSYFHTGIHELYDLDNDIGETTDIYNAKPEIVDELAYIREAWTSQLINPVFQGITNPPNYASPSPSDYLVNHNFELGNITGWNNWNNSITSTKVKSGTYAGLIKSNKTGSLKQIMELKANTAYQLKFWYKSDNSSGETAKIILQDEVTSTKFLDDVITTTGTFKEYDNTFTTGSEKNQISLSVWKDIAGNSNLYVDDFEIIEVGGSADQLRLKVESLLAMESGQTYQARAVEIPLTAWLGTKSWEIIDGTGSATIDYKGLITTVNDGTITLKVSSLHNPSIFDEIELTIGTPLGVESETASKHNLFSVVGSNVVDNTISIKTHAHLNKVTIQIFSLTGKLVYIKELNNLEQSNHTFELKNVSSGMYFLNLTTLNAQQTLKFIKN
ncbi:sulfatase-like hydrolase/transferase [Polaribacter pectinis]|uniref:Sulfatase-like hydrolase/transferase n=1 Tax=Polaribacter pectinis TaxID=2738844 RepID=A0A7G9L6R6_9FLAO|nr:sulfatase-like hydrolase/transferase [Polaribacter pectinis]QNM84315.1 sulfatase-like hydrolase/transferase [Polaribacter pectinis]